MADRSASAVRALPRQKATGRTRQRRTGAPHRRRAAPGTGETDEWLTIDEARRIVKVGRRTFEQYLSMGTGPRFKRMAGQKGPVRIKRSWLDEWMEAGT